MSTYCNRKKISFEVLKNAMFNDHTLNSEFTLDELEFVQRKLKNGKAVGVDIIPNEVLTF